MSFQMKILKIIRNIIGISVLIVTLMMPNTIFGKENFALTGEQFLELLKPVIAKFEKETGGREGDSLENYLLPLNPKKKVSRAEAICMINQIDWYYRGDFQEEDKYTNIARYQRLGDLSNYSFEMQRNLMEAYGKGIVVGTSKGLYTAQRELELKKRITKTAFKKMKARLLEPKKRREISFDGQVIRTTNLPKNYKSFPYVLEGYPNSFYEMAFIYQRTMHSKKPVIGDQYIPPVNMSDPKYMDQYKFNLLKKGYSIVERNLWLKLNYDYRTCKKKWREELAKTYCHPSGKEGYQSGLSSIKEYQKKAQKNHVILKADVVTADPGTLHYSRVGGYYVRCYVKFKVISADFIPTVKSQKQNEIVFGDDVTISGLKKNKSIAFCFDYCINTCRDVFSDKEIVGIWWDMIGDEMYRVKQWKPEDSFGDKASTGYFVDFD
ncbi:MAG: hypothetical protein KH020_01855 [Clostridiales bacterium]|nr:hypothetical protein [Clostridiales bacterium]